MGINGRSTVTDNSFGNIARVIQTSNNMNTAYDFDHRLTTDAREWIKSTNTGAREVGSGPYD